MKREEIIIKILGLMRLGDENSNPNKAEAEAARKKAAEMMAKFEISQSDLTNDEKIEMQQRVYPKGTQEWQLKLRNIVCYHAGVMYIRSKRTQSAYYVGCPTDIKIAKHMISQLELQVESMLKDYRKNLKRVKSVQKAMAAYKDGLIRGISISFIQLSKDILAYKRQAGLQPVSQHVTKYDKAEEHALEHLNISYSSSNFETGIHSKRGRNDADKIKLRAGVGSNTPNRKLT